MGNTNKNNTRNITVGWLLASKELNFNVTKPNAN